VYRFRLAVGTPWHSVDLFFKIACCKRPIIIDGEEEGHEEHLELIEPGKEAEQQLQENSPVQVFPNPFSDEVTLNFSKEEIAGEAIISIKNFLGDEVFSTKTSEETLKINTTTWEEGIYICTITIGEKSFTQRIVK
jgi:hypothetical protein